MTEDTRAHEKSVRVLINVDHVTRFERTNYGVLVHYTTATGTERVMTEMKWNPKEIMLYSSTLIPEILNHLTAALDTWEESYD